MFQMVHSSLLLIYFGQLFERPLLCLCFIVDFLSLIKNLKRFFEVLFFYETGCDIGHRYQVMRIEFAALLVKFNGLVEIFLHILLICLFFNLIKFTLRLFGVSVSKLGFFFLLMCFILLGIIVLKLRLWIELGRLLLLLLKWRLLLVALLLCK